MANYVADGYVASGYFGDSDTVGGIKFDPAALRIILTSAAVTATELYSRWCDWLLTDDNLKYLPAFRATGGDDLGGGLLIPPYFFLLNGWRVRPMEANHNLVITGNLFVDGGGVPVVSTLGTYQVNVNYTVPVQAQGIVTSGSTGPTAAEIAAEILAAVQIATASEIAAEILAAAQAAPIHSDLRRVRGQAVTGSGTELDPWGP